MNYPKIILIVEGGVVQNILSTEDFNGDIFIINHDELNEYIVETEYDLRTPIFWDMPLQKDNEEVEKWLDMSLEDYLMKYQPEYLKEVKEELKREAEAEYERTLKRIGD